MPPVQRDSATAVGAAGDEASATARSDASEAASANRAIGRWRDEPAMGLSSPGTIDRATDRSPLVARSPDVVHCRDEQAHRKSTGRGPIVEPVTVVLNVKTEHDEAIEAVFRAHELPAWQARRHRGRVQR